jgi:nickel-dependent lactate racemase
MNKEIVLSSNELPLTWHVDVAETRTTEPIEDLPRAIRVALSHPLASLELRDLCDSEHRVCVVVDELKSTQLTACEVVLEELSRANVSMDRVTVLVATGNIKSREEQPQFVRHFQDDVSEVNDLGVYDNVPLQINYRAVEADVLIGVSALKLDDESRDGGSCVTVAFGCASNATLNEIRHSRFLDDRIARSDGELTQLDRIAHEGAKRAGLSFAVDFLLNENGDALAVKAGAPLPVNENLRMIAHELREASAPNLAYDLLIADNCAPNLYRASETPMRIGLSRDSALMRGGMIVLPVDVSNQEKEIYDAHSFYDAWSNGDTTEEVIRLLAGHTLEPGEARAYLLAHALQKHPTIVVGCREGARLKHFICAKDLTEATELAESYIGRRPRALILPNSSYTIPTGALFVREDEDDRVNSLLRDIEFEK